MTKTVSKKKPARKAGARIAASIREAIDWTQGKPSAVRVSKVKVPTTDVRKLRRALGLSQSAFASKYGFHAATIRNWEQGRTRPDGPARVLLAVLAKNPGAVEDALQQAR